MSYGPTAQLPEPVPPRRAGRRALIVLVIGLVLLAILAGVDRAAAAYAQNRVASQLKGYGFPTKPSVTIEGFPFLTQLIGRHIGVVDISGSDFRAGPVTASVRAKAVGVSLSSSYVSGTISKLTGTGLIPFWSLSNAAGAAGAPGLKISAAGPHEVKLTAKLGVASVTGLAAIERSGPDRFTVHLVSAGGIPVSLLAPIRDLTVTIPALPLALAVKTVTVTGQGVAVQVSGHHVPFGRRQAVSWRAASRRGRRTSP